MLTVTARWWGHRDHHHHSMVSKQRSPSRKHIHNSSNPDPIIFLLEVVGWRMIRSRLKSQEQMFNHELSLWTMQARRCKEGPRRNSVPKRNKQELWLLGSSGWGSSLVPKYLWGVFGIFMAVLTSRGMISQTMYGWWIWGPEFFIKVQIVTKFIWHRTDCWLFFPHLV